MGKQSVCGPNGLVTWPFGDLSRCDADAILAGQRTLPDVLISMWITHVQESAQGDLLQTPLRQDFMQVWDSSA
jgi:hypothetical protein